MENKYITVAYKLYVMQDGQKTLVEEATVEHPFQFISGLGTTLERFETEITALKKGDKFEFVIPTAEAYGEYMPEGVRAWVLKKSDIKKAFHLTRSFFTHLNKGSTMAS